MPCYFEQTPFCWHELNDNLAVLYSIPCKVCVGKASSPNKSPDCETVEEEITIW